MRVLVADAEEQRRQALVDVLAAEPDLEVLTPAATVAEIASTPEPAVVLLVGGLRFSGPVEALGQVRHDDAPAWVVLTEDTDELAAIIAAGADGCLAESSTPVQIGAAVRAAANGDQASLDQPVTGPLVQRVRRERPPLTEREIEVLRLVEAGLGNQEIAARLYLSLSSVKSHLSHTYGRLGVRRREAAVAEARRQGLI
ncbi:MAG TPA: DNA-binding response regulator [Janibacter terrae]|nr:DNA-binding response regulator [Janibacter terrae]